MSKRKQTSVTMGTPRSTRSTEKEKEKDTDDEHSTDSQLEEQYHDRPMTYSLFRELMREMKDDINSNTDKKVFAITQDVIFIKNSLTTFGEKMEEAENRISDAEDRIEKIEEIGGEMDTFRDLFDKSVEQTNREACLARKNNVIINGLPGDPKGGRREAMASLKKLCVVDLKLGEDWFAEAEIVEVYRFPAKKKTDHWPLFVRFGDISFKDDMFKAATNLKGTNISLRHDLAPWLIIERGRLIKISTNLRKEPHNRLTKLRETPFKVKLVTRKNAEEEWKIWKEDG